MEEKGHRPPKFSGHEVGKGIHSRYKRFKTNIVLSTDHIFLQRCPHSIWSGTTRGIWNSVEEFRQMLNSVTQRNGAGVMIKSQVFRELLCNMIVPRPQCQDAEVQKGFFFFFCQINIKTFHSSLTPSLQHKRNPFRKKCEANKHKTKQIGKGRMGTKLINFF